ncbi:hypothetical protein RHMOL_Rhmol07G0274000 [Rhododendron molle]|uniref:Uncharacterized protein n=1 Tax=Rhododendron molle TaxID=49168 RepID=A0ACC0N5J1_RHOML|nr:hypothetical protein RHMOL_Rhmol07G0274000 [Rhododendron molle]
MSLSRCSATRSLRSLSTTSAVATATATASKPLPSLPPPNAMTYDRLALSVNQKLKLHHNPDPRFSTNNSPHPTLADHTPILSSPLTRITNLPFGLRITTESDLASKTATVCLLNKQVALSLSFISTPLYHSRVSLSLNPREITKKMAIRHLLSPSRRSATCSLRSFSTTSVVATALASKPLPSPPPLDAMTYDHLALSVNQKLKLHHNPDPRFSTHNSPHPTLADHTPIFSSPLTRITILPFGLRITTESDLASKTATVCLLNKQIALSLSFISTLLYHSRVSLSPNPREITKKMAIRHLLPLSRHPLPPICLHRLRRRHNIKTAPFPSAT